ncbi:MAG TPA: phosphatase PAP2 family protein [Candidatus Kryptobacter bacterium]|nr:MAG: hypothetical protein B7Z63_00725 [Ignavibacteriae bacterium 37-53-5]HQT90793.1 phosphatase PAP2 family protein [Candidatus Kryptobacter bacterium]
MCYGKFSFGVAVCSCILVASTPISFAQNLEGAHFDSTAIRQQVPYSPSGNIPSNPNDEYLPKWYDMIGRIPGDWFEFSRETVQLNNIPTIVGVAGLTAALVVVDRQWWWTEKKWYSESPNFRGFSDWMNLTFDGRIEFGIVGGFAACGFLFEDARALRTASQTTEAILACGGVVQLLKCASGRESPLYSTARTGKWDFFPDHAEYSKTVQRYDAFPSGHLSTAMATLIVIAENYPELTWLKPAGYVVLTAVASSLVACGVHWWSDYPLALVLGYTFGQIAAHPLGMVLAEKKSGTDTKISLTPAAFPGGAGLGVLISF